MASRSPSGIGLDPVVVVGDGEDAVPSVRHPITFSETPTRYDRPPPRLDEHGDEIRAWLKERRMSDELRFPTSLGTSTADEIRLLGQDLTADLMGKVGFGELAFWLVAMRRPTPRRCGFSRPCWSRSPTTASPPRLSRPG